MASVLVSDSRPSQASVTYTLTASNITTSSVMCMTMKFTPNADGSGTSLPSGMNITGATVNTSSTYLPAYTSWSNGVSNNVLTFKHATVAQTPASSGPRTVIINGVTNGSTVETPYYLVFSTFSDTTCTTPRDNVTVSYWFVNGQLATADVLPALTFTLDPLTSGTVNGATINISSTDGTIPFGTIIYNTPKIAAHRLNIATNANLGYTVTIAYTGVLAAPGHNWTNHGGSNAAPSTWVNTDEAFGYTTTDSTLSAAAIDRFTNPANGWAAFSTNPAEVAYKSGATTTADQIDIGYQISAGAGTPAGSYTTTIVLVATPIY